MSFLNGLKDNDLKSYLFWNSNRGIKLYELEKIGITSIPSIYTNRESFTVYNIFILT